MLLFPTPFGPQKTTNPGKKGMDTLFLKDLNPCKVSLVILVILSLDVAQQQINNQPREDVNWYRTPDYLR